MRELGARGARPAAHLLLGIEHVARDAHGGQAASKRGERGGRAAAAAADVVRVHRVEKREIARHVEARDELGAVMRQV